MPIFRSRSFAFVIDNDAVIQSQKVYYESEDEKLKQSILNGYVDNKVLTNFEYSTHENGSIDSFNFHVNLNKDYHLCYADLPNNLQKCIEKIPSLFDSSFKNYTIGYRLDGNNIVGKTYYFYPVARKDYNRIGIIDIDDKKLFMRMVENFVEFLSITDSHLKNEISGFI